MRLSYVKQIIKEELRKVLKESIVVITSNKGSVKVELPDQFQFKVLSKRQQQILKLLQEKIQNALNSEDNVTVKELVTEFKTKAEQFWQEYLDSKK